MGECSRCPWLSALWGRCFDKRRDVEPGGKNEYSERTGRPKLGGEEDMDRVLTASRAEDGDVYTALWDFDARADEELSFKSGDRFRIVRRSGDWWTANKIDPIGRVLATGIVPYNYLEQAGEAVDAQPEPQPQDLSHTTVDEWELPKEDFTLEEQLGSGYFADVHRGKWKNRINVAIKILKNNASLNQREFQMEVQVLKRLRHRHLISLFAICTSSTPYYIITELMEKGNLLDFLRSKEGETLDLVSLIDMSAQVADGMAYLEEQKSIHRDLAARNVLVGEGYICKVADFGLARFIKEPIYISEEKKIPYKWTAPEAITHGRFSSKSDVWSFGILLYEIVTYGGVPYPGFTSSEVVRQITHHGYRMPAPPKCPRFVYDIMLSCWSEEPGDRPNFQELKSDLENVNRYTELD